MTRIDEAARVIAGCWPEGQAVEKTRAAILARALAGAGLLAPELPRMQQVTDHLHVTDVNENFAVSRHQGTVTLVVERPAHEHYMGAWSARALALALLAAANAAEGGSDGVA